MGIVFRACQVLRLVVFVLPACYAQANESATLAGLGTPLIARTLQGDIRGGAGLVAATASLAKLRVVAPQASTLNGGIEIAAPSQPAAITRYLASTGKARIRASASLDSPVVLTAASFRETIAVDQGPVATAAIGLAAIAHPREDTIGEPLASLHAARGELSLTAVLTPGLTSAGPPTNAALTGADVAVLQSHLTTTPATNVSHNGLSGIAVPGRGEQTTAVGR